MFATPLFASANGEIFTRNFSIGTQGKDVLILQQLLNIYPGTHVAETGPGAPGFETTYFGKKTDDAMRRFKEIYRSDLTGTTTAEVNIAVRKKLNELVSTLPDLSMVVVESEQIEELSGHEHGASEADPKHSVWYNSTVIFVPEDMWVTGFYPEVVGAPRYVLHHATLFRLGKNNGSCTRDEEDTHEIFSSSLNTVDQYAALPKPYALHLKKGDMLALDVMLHNPEPPMGPGAHAHDFSVRVTLVGERDNKGDDAHQPASFVRLRLDDTPCQEPLKHEAFLVPSSTPQFTLRDKFFGVSTSSATFVVPQDGTILSVGTNFWPMKGGRSVSMLVNGVTVETQKSEQFDTSIPWAWRIPLKNGFIHQVRAGDIVSTEAVYENPHSYPILDASGMLAFYFAPK